MKNLLEVYDLKTYFYLENGVVPAVDGVSFTLRAGEIIGIVGESGCGKSALSLSLLKLISVPGKIVGGSIIFDGQDLIKLKDREMCKIRGRKISMIFQEPLTSLNPVFSVGYQIVETICLHQRLNQKEAKKKCIELLKMVGISRAEQVVHEYPHSLSGGMRQRAMIAMALSCRPKILIADEPTTALDVTVQAQILEIMKDLNKKIDTSIILITHDLGVIAEVTERVIVMYTGKVVEETDVKTLFKNPKHPYTIALLNSRLNLGSYKKKLEPISGAVPDFLNLPTGCHFHPRCPHAINVCRKEMPPVREIGTRHKVRCWLYNDAQAGGSQV